MMAFWRTKSGAVLLAGLIVGSLATAALIHGPGVGDVHAQAGPQPFTPGRYQVSSFAYGYGYAAYGANGNSSGNQSKWGAYVVDTQTGDLYMSIEGGKPHLVGRIGDK
jgi:hypothetical protein